jgi:hypothetical protein
MLIHSSYPIIHTDRHTCAHTYASYSYIHTCMHAHIHPCIHTHIHACVYAHTGTYLHAHTCTHTYMHTHTYTHMYTCLHACTHTCMHTYIHMHTYTCTHACTNTWTYTYINTCIHTCICHWYIHAWTHTYICHRYMHTCTLSHMHKYIHTYTLIRLQCDPREYVWQDYGRRPQEGQSFFHYIVKLGRSILTNFKNISRVSATFCCQNGLNTLFLHQFWKKLWSCLQPHKLTIFSMVDCALVYCSRHMA